MHFLRENKATWRNDAGLINTCAQVPKADGLHPNACKEALSQDVELTFSETHPHFLHFFNI